MNNIFEFLDWVLKKKCLNNREPIVEDNITGFMFNRWLSMSDPDVARIINITHNRWANTETDNDFSTLIRFYYSILPKITTRTTYIKKPVKKVEKENDDYTISINKEISIREKRLFDRMLSELDK